MATLEALEARIAALEAASGAAASGLAPNYLQVDPVTGKISAALSGSLQAQGLYLPALGAPAPLTYSRVTWTTDGTPNGAVVAEIQDAYSPASGSGPTYVSELNEHNEYAYSGNNGRDTGARIAHRRITVQGQAYQLYDELWDSGTLTDPTNPSYYRIVLPDGTSHTVIDTQGVSSFAQTSNNLSDVANPVTAIQNLGGLQKADNLSDVANTATALGNIGGLAKASNLGDVANVNTARHNLRIGKPSRGFGTAGGAISSGYANYLATNVSYDPDLNLNAGYWDAPAWCSMALAFASCGWPASYVNAVRLEVWDGTTNTLIESTADMGQPQLLGNAGVTASFPFQTTPGHGYYWRCHVTASSGTVVPWSGPWEYVAFLPIG